MAATVNTAFDQFMREVVNLEPAIVSAARASRDNLLKNIAEFDGKDDFFKLYTDYNLHFGSFARKTKCRELDDIDLMIGIAANNATYYSCDPWNNVHINVNTMDPAQKGCMREDGTLNSTLVSNKFKKKLTSVREFKRSEIRRNGEAVIVNLISKDWSFDIVPCFKTVIENDMRSYYLIPNGEGNWKKTAPDKDRVHISNTNQRKGGRVLELIRLCKKWNKVKNAKSLPSYLLETMIVNFADLQIELSSHINKCFCEALLYIAHNVTRTVFDMKGIQGNINTLNIEDQKEMQQKAWGDYLKACNALKEESYNLQKCAVETWGEILGADFPKYGQ